MNVIQHILGLGFLFVAMMSVSSYNDELAPFRISIFYRELKPMRQRWGSLPGTILHVLAYVVPPLGFGILFLMGMVF